MGVITDLGTDVTLAHKTMVCPKCEHDEYVYRNSVVDISHLTLLHSAVFFQDQSKRKETRMVLFYVCTKCNHAYTDYNLSSEAQPELD